MLQSHGITSGGMDAFSTPTVSSSSGRRRSQRACDMCYRKKTKCELEDSHLVCVQCTRRGSQCVFPGNQPQPQPQPQQEEQRDEYVHSLKIRLEKVEALLKMAGVLPEDDMTNDNLDENEDEDEDGDGDDGDYGDEIGDFHDADDDDCPGDDWGVPDQHKGSSENTSRPSFESTTSPDTDHRSNKHDAGGDLEGTPIFRAHESDDPRYLGRSCSLSILSRGGIEWIKSKTGDLSFLRLLSTDSVHDSPWGTWRPDVFHDLFASQVYRPLPSRLEVFSLINDYFRSANRLFPIFHEGSFMKMVEWQYTQQTCDDAARWASINMVICLAYEFRYSNSLKPEKDRERARMYFKNAMSVFTELALRRTDLLSVQALMSMAFFLRGNSGTQSAMPFTTAAMRSCQRMGLHRNIHRPDLSLTDQEQRRRVFWVAFTVDQSTCLRAGNAPSQHPDDFDVPLPQELEEEKKNPEMATSITFFRQLCRMSVIKSRIFCRLYAAKAMQKPPHETYKVVKELHAELEEWRKDYPLEAPERKIAQTDFLFGFGAIGLHLVYYNALIMIHRIPLLLSFLISSRENEPEDLKSFSKARASKAAVICVTAARDTLKLVNNMPWGDIAWIWSLLYYVFLAAATIFSNILRDTHSSSVRDDLQALNMASTFFATLVPGDGPANYAGFMAKVCGHLERTARLVVAKNEKRARSPEDKDQAQHPPTSKRHLSRTASTSTSKLKPRQRPTTLRTSMNTDATGSFQYHTSDTPRASNPSATASSYLADFGIPESIEGLPPVNSSGYVVPMSPGETDFSNATFPNQPPPPPLTTNYTGLGLSNMNTNASNLNAMSWPQTHLPDQQGNTTTSSPLDPNESPFSQTSAQSASIPESWQVPLTADWEYGDNLWSGLFPTEAIAAAGVGQEIPMPILSAESYLNQGPSQNDLHTATNHPELPFGTDNIDYAQMYSSSAAQGSNPDPDNWPQGFLGLF